MYGERQRAYFSRWTVKKQSARLWIFTWIIKSRRGAIQFLDMSTIIQDLHPKRINKYLSMSFAASCSNISIFIAYRFWRRISLSIRILSLFLSKASVILHYVFCLGSLCNFIIIYFVRSFRMINKKYYS